MNVFDALHAKRSPTLPSERAELRQERARIARAVREVRHVDEERDRRPAVACASSRSTTARHSSARHRVAGRVVARVVQEDERAPLRRELRGERAVERGDVELRRRLSNIANVATLRSASSESVWYGPQ